MAKPGFRAGLVALVGKPNVGKSTLMNTIVGQKVSIVSNKPQTTRRRVLGIATTDDHQIVFLDTPGVHQAHTRLDRAMYEAARSALTGIDAIVVVVDSSHHPGELDKEVAKLLKGPDGKPIAPVIVCLNKMDLLKAENVIPFTEAFCEAYGTEESMLTIANRGRNVHELIKMIVAHLPEQDPIYPDDEFTDQSSRFLAGELVREKILTFTRQEVPYATAVIVEGWDEEPGLTRIDATIIVEKSSQRGILIGKGGAFLRKIGEAARKEIEEMLGTKIFLGLHVRVQEDWRMNPRVLHELEYSE